MRKTITLLIERNQTFTPDKIIAASYDRKPLILCARERNLHLDYRTLDRTNRAKIDEFNEACLEEIPVLEADEDSHITITRPEA